MNTTSKRIASLSLLTLILTACGEGAVPFNEIEVGRYAVKVDPNSTGTEGSGAYPIDSTEGDAVAEENYASVVDDAFGDSTDSFDATDDESATDGSGTTGTKPSKTDKPTSGSGSGSSAGSGAGAGSGGGSSAEDKKTVDLCRKLFANKAAKLVMVSPDSSNEGLVLDASTVIAAMLSGNQQKLNLNISGVERMAGVCIVATGNQPKVSIMSDVDLGQLVYIGRGNQSQSTVVMANGHNLESSYIELKGNGNTMAMFGVDNSHCENAVIKGNAQNSVSCKSPAK